tara:strand:+ start:619 stop:780 length:162 start_codon:yes stop_codon:yes gene_type:complete
MALNEDERRLIESCIKAYENNIKFNRKKILELRRQMECFEKKQMIPIGLEIKK